MNDKSPDEFDIEYAKLIARQFPIHDSHGNVIDYSNINEFQLELLALHEEYGEESDFEARRRIFERLESRINIQKKYNDKNLGCKKSNLEALNWFFKKEKFGIILEDDCIASVEFFRFCEIMLKKYKNNKKIYCISGSNFQKKSIDDNSYYFSKYSHCWGWATWRDRWQDNDGHISFWQKFKKTNKWNSLHKYKIEKQYWNKIFENVYNGKFDSWAYPWSLSVWKKEGLTITPNANLIKNIGFGEESTHSLFLKNSIKYLNKNRYKAKIVHPKKIIANNDADLYVFKNHFQGHKYLWPYRGYDLLIKIIFKSLILIKKFFRKI